jgi:thiol-disulfide isomerase/thioredoxin
MIGKQFKIIFFFFQIILSVAANAQGNKIGDTAPLLTNQFSPDNKPVTIESFKGKYLFIDFWGSWCAPCRSANPTLIKIYNKYKSANFEILGIAIERKKDEWLKAINQDKLPWPQVSDLKFWQSEAVALYGIYSLPFNVLLDADGKIAAINLSHEELGAKLKELLKENK